MVNIFNLYLYIYFFFTYIYSYIIYNKDSDALQYRTMCFFQSRISDPGSRLLTTRVRPSCVYRTKRGTSECCVELLDCCTYLMTPGDRLRATPTEGDCDRELDLNVCSIAAFNGHIGSVCGRPIPWNCRTTEMACRAGHIDCLKYLHKNLYETDGHVSAACAGQISTLEYAWIHGFSFPSKLCTLIERFGSVESLRYLRSLGFSWDVTTRNNRGGRSIQNPLAFLKYLR